MDEGGSKMRQLRRATRRAALPRLMTFKDCKITIRGQDGEVPLNVTSAEMTLPGTCPACGGNAAIAPGDEPVKGWPWQSMPGLCPECGHVALSK